MERRGGRGGLSRGMSRGGNSRFNDRGGGSPRGRGFGRGGRGTGRSDSRFSRDERSDRPPFDRRGGIRGGSRGRGGFSRDFRGGGRSGERDFGGGRMERGRGVGRGMGKRPASGLPQAGKRPRYEGGASYSDANGYSVSYDPYSRNSQAESSYHTQSPPYRGAGGSGAYGGVDSVGYGSGGYMQTSSYDNAAGNYAGYSAPQAPTSDPYGDSYKSKRYEGSSGYGQSREYSSQPRSRY